jgi:hypothetical protein
MSSQKAKEKGERYGEERIFVSGLDARPNQRYWIACPDGSLLSPRRVVHSRKIKKLFTGP